MIFHPQRPRRGRRRQQHAVTIDNDTSFFQLVRNALFDSLLDYVQLRVCNKEDQME
jgi:hypothetical protein